MGRPAGWMTSSTGRSAMKSSRALAHRREVQREFWIEIAKGLWFVGRGRRGGSRRSPAVDTRWFRHAGGMTPFEKPGLFGRDRSLPEREEIALLRARNSGIREIVRRLNRSPSTVSLELRRNAAIRHGKLNHRALVALWEQNWSCSGQWWSVKLGGQAAQVASWNSCTASRATGSTSAATHRN